MWKKCFVHWWALCCNHWPFLFCKSRYLFLTAFCFIFVIIPNLTLWKFKTLVLPCQFPVLPLLCSHHLGTHHDLFCIFCHLVAPVCSNISILTQNGLVFCTLNSCWHRQDTSVAHVCSQSICKCYMFPSSFFHSIKWIVLCSFDTKFLSTPVVQQFFSRLHLGLSFALKRNKQ